ncbi:methylene-fatty-acyl-phospholipid synthase/demethylmenaquinone methyltransferase [Acididesulfobacillus acetoxydans]|uniref:Methylene-fatty-acyl-phospholipid synthase/demethylmenaquinone methyltransferase n=1 Tax=Acididesulfobacillus acetoxydans TaxID=1561005 RepID=A0A8S0XC23_9FIRM|nr:class I SAM-dependent methyltransferase [Acididesulfobacillus acetoxydans]CAA7601896.1 methylene-fatty-acyl-phospholipid synthase/demethylmenaquinone methyltransferase [Acididesulfobacillus acetoxydans]CEJ08260.1 Methyltransferase type 11 [Acididesulfobacillus acetoxydans]
MPVNSHDHVDSHEHHNSNHLMNFAEREKLLPSRQILEHFGLKPGDSLADLGCGFGFFALRAAEMVGPRGKIEAVDVEPERLKVLAARAEERQVRERIHIHQAEDESVPLPAESVAIVLIAGVLHELGDPLAYLREAWRILSAGGRIWIIEWQKKETPMGPPLADRKSAQEWSSLLEAAGFGNIWFQPLAPGHVLLKAAKVSHMA